MRAKQETPLTTLTYQKAGVDPEKAAKILKDFSHYLKQRPRDPAVLGGIGPFAASYSLKECLAPYEDPVLVTCCDGVGTKAKLAADWGGISGLGTDLVAMNVNDLLCAGAEPRLFLDYFACGELDETQLSTLLRSIQTACEEAECTLVGGETAEMPGVYRKGDFDLAGFAVGFGERSKLLGPHQVQRGDTVIAIASSGIHSNGYSLIRKLVDAHRLKANEKAPFADETWAEVLLKPTQLYVKALKPWLGRVHALAHLTGGGLFENLPRVLPSGHRARIQAWTFPPLFEWLERTSEMTQRQMLQTFNCGVGMIAICSPNDATDLLTHLQNQALSAWHCGEIEKLSSESSEPEVVWE